MQPPEVVEFLPEFRHILMLKMLKRIYTAISYVPQNYFSAGGPWTRGPPLVESTMTITLQWNRLFTLNKSHIVWPYFNIKSCFNSMP